MLKKLKIEIETSEPMLGTKTADPEVFTRFVASKRPDGPARDELDAAARQDPDGSAGSTVFHRDEGGRPFIWDYQVKGFFKDACQSLRCAPGSRSSAVKAYKKAIDGLVFVAPRRIPLGLPEGGEVGVVERPLRAQTMRGERVALARSESVPAGTRLSVEVVLLDPALEPALREWLDYGALRGIGQWRNSGMGRFRWRELP